MRETSSSEDGDDLVAAAAGTEELEEIDEAELEYGDSETAVKHLMRDRRRTLSSLTSESQKEEESDETKRAEQRFLLLLKKAEVCFFPLFLHQWA